MNHTSSVTIPRLHVGVGTTVHSLTVFPVWVEARSVRGLHWSGCQLSVGELDDGPSVGQVQATNSSSRPAVLLEGDLVEGGWQHRMLAASSIIPAGTTSVVEARCVEQDRWHGQGRHQATRRRAAYSVRAARRSAQGPVNQGDVWRRVNRFERLYGHTPTASLTDHLQRRPAPTFPLLDGQRGVIIGIGGRAVAAEIFGRSYGLASRWTGIIAAAWLDAQPAPSVPTPAEQARELARRIAPASLRATTAAGLGHQVITQQGPLALRGLVYRRAAADPDGLVHLTAIDTTHPYVLAV